MSLLLASAVILLRVPDGGIQPQVVTTPEYAHLIYFRGDPQAGDLYYSRSRDGGVTWTQGIPVNSQPGAVMAAGNIRGAQIAAGKDGRLHVAWMGSKQAQPKAGMFYTRLNNMGSGFEPERNIITRAWGLDGGGTVAASPDGSVYVAWHAPVPGKEGEENRAVWVAVSRDEGKTFADEKRAWDELTGACSCCGMKAYAGDGNLRILYRGAEKIVYRDMFLLTSTDQGVTFKGSRVDKWEISACMMSTAWLAERTAAWEARGQVFALSGERILSPPAAPTSSPASVSPPGSSMRKYPVAIQNGKGLTLFVWTDGMGWNRGGSLAWQTYGPSGEPVETGGADGVPVWSLVAAFVRRDGAFVILY